MKVAGVLVLCIASQVCGSPLTNSELINFGSDEYETEEVAVSTNSDGKARELFIGALKHLSQDLKVTRSKIETKIKSLEKAKLDLEHVIALDIYVNVTLKNIDSEDEAGTRVDVSRSQKKKKYSIFKSSEMVDWDSANRLCQDKELELASVESEAEQKELEAAIKSSGIHHNYVWIGGHRVEYDGEFVWSSSGRQFSYTNPIPGDNSDQPFNCVQISVFNSYRWLHITCSDLIGYYACEYSG